MVNLKEGTHTVKEAVVEFYEALQAIFDGDSTPMAKIWSHAEDVTYLGPQGGILVGWHQVQKAWKEQANLKLKGSVEARKVHILEEGDLAIVQNYEAGTNFPKGVERHVQIRATNIFRKEGGKWKMISHQTDKLPFL